MGEACCCTLSKRRGGRSRLRPSMNEELVAVGGVMTEALISYVTKGIYPVSLGQQVIQTVEIFGIESLGVRTGKLGRSRGSSAV